MKIKKKQFTVIPYMEYEKAEIFKRVFNLGSHPIQKHFRKRLHRNFN